MHVEFILAAIVLVVAILVGADYFRRTGDNPQEYAPQEYAPQEYPGSPAHDTGRETATAPRAGSAPSPSAFEAAQAGPGADGRPHREARYEGPRYEGPPYEGPRYEGTRYQGTLGQSTLDRSTLDRSTRAAAPRGAGKTWLVRARLSLLALVPAAAAALVTVSILHALAALHGGSFHSGVSSMRDGAIASAILALVCAVVVLAAGLWSATVLIRSVLRPLHQLRAGAVDLAEVWLPDALRRIIQVGGEGGPPGVRPVGVSSRDEIGEVARALDQVQGEVLRMAGDEAGLRERLSDLFAELSARGQALMDRQIRLIGELEPGERDADRLASLVTASDLATRMRRYSQNLLVLAGRELPGRWYQPVMLVDVIRAAASQIGEHERVSVRAQPGLAVSGPAASDVAHLIAELAENATSLSAADTTVGISGRGLATGGVLVEVSDQGVGMHPETIAQANWRLDNPPPVDAAVSRNMGLFVVGRLAARHGIKVRLQPASAGGLIALVWLPDAIVALPDTRASADLGAEREARASSVRPAPTPADLIPRQPSPPASAIAFDQPPRHARAAGPQRPALRLRPVRAAARGQPPGGGGAPADHPAQAGDDASGAPVPAASQVEDPADERRLPIYEAVESDWFGNRRTPVGAAAAAGSSWRPATDRGWDAARTVLTPSSSGVTTAGLPVRVPRANLVPGTIGDPPSDAPAPARSAAATRDRLSGFQRGASQGRAAVHHDDQEKSS